jgi:hypothetical protein
MGSVPSNFSLLAYIIPEQLGYAPAFNFSDSWTPDICGIVMSVMIKSK